MANLKAKDADSVTKFLKATGIGTDDDPLIVEHSSPAILVQLQQSVAQLNTIVQQLGDIAQLKSQLQTLTGITGTINNFPATQAVSGTVGVNNFPTTQPVSGTVNVGNFPVNQSISGSVNISNFPATQPVSGTIAISSLPVSIQSITDSQITYIETVFGLGSGGAFTGVGRDAQNKNTVRGWVWTNANGILYVDQSTNNSTWRQTEAIAITGSTAQATDYVFRLMSRYYRLRYTNGNNAQTTFELISTVFGIGL